MMSHKFYHINGCGAQNWLLVHLTFSSGNTAFQCSSILGVDSHVLSV